MSKKHLISSLIILFLIGFSNPSKLMYAQTSEVQALREEVKILREEMKAMRAEMQTLRGERNAPSSTAVSEVINPEDSPFQFYGFVNLQYVSDSTRTNNGNSSFWVLRDTSVDNNNAENNIHARLSRLGVNLQGEDPSDWFWGAKYEGKIEVDFFGGGGEAGNNFRMRHAYIKAYWDNGFSILAGQTDDLFSLLEPDSEPNTIMLGSGNIGDRRPQLRAAWESDLSDDFGISLMAGVFRSGALNDEDLDGDLNNDGVDKSAPMYQGRLGLTFPSWVDGKRIGLGLSGVYAKEDVNTAVGTAMKKSFTAQAIHFDATVPLWKGIINEDDYLQFSGEIWSGQNLDDVLGGVLQGVSPVTGREIDAQGGWGQVQYKFNRYWDFAGGFGIDNPDGRDLAAMGLRKNSTWFLTNNFHVGEKYTISLRYLDMNTDYFGSSADNNRFIVMFQWNF